MILLLPCPNPHCGGIGHAVTKACQTCGMGLFTTQRRVQVPWLPRSQILGVIHDRNQRSAAQVMREVMA